MNDQATAFVCERRRKLAADTTLCPGDEYAQPL
jgi:hypothetical protein